MTHVLVVCTGNMCRSPVTETLLRERLGHAATFTSAGTHARAGRAIPRPMRRALREFGIAAPHGRSTPVTAAHVWDADVVIALGDEHRAYLQLMPQTDPARVVTLGELQRAAEAGAPLDGDTDEERIAGLPAAATAHRAASWPQRAPAFSDPYGGDERDYRETAERLVAAVTKISGWVLGDAQTMPHWAAVHEAGPAAPEPR